MPTSSVAVRSLALAVFGLAAASAFAQGPNVTGRPADLPPPPPGPLESRFLEIPERSAPAPRTRVDISPSATPAAPAAVTATPAPSTLPPAAMQTPPARPTTTATLSPEPTTPPPTKDAVTGSIPFAALSANLSEITRSEIDRIAKNIVDKKLRQIELRAFAGGDDPESRKIALARALVVRSYLIDRGVKSRIEVGAYAGDGDRVDILVPNT
jgi:outer membrane protein OmpA-like peptidoglycan-associated protein